MNTQLGRLPRSPDTYYLHDIALVPVARRSGAATTIVQMLIAEARSLAVETVSLIAVSNSEDFWRKQGFLAETDEALKPKLVSYGADSRFMVLPLR